MIVVMLGRCIGTLAEFFHVEHLYADTDMI